MKGLMKEIFKTWFNLQPSCYIEILFTKNSLNKQGRNSIHEQSKWKASWRKSLRLDSTFKASCYIEILFTKNSLNKQGWNSIYKQSKWKASWRNSLTLDSTFKASCYIEILFTKKTVWKNKAKILFTNRANERPHEGNL